MKDLVKMLYYTDFSSRLRIVQISSNILCKCKCILMEVITTIPAAATELGFLRMELHESTSLELEELLVLYMCLIIIG